jgi:pyrroloquinoline-quinone synthase
VSVNRNAGLDPSRDMNLAELEARPPLAPEEFIAWLRREGGQRYHDAHPFHVLMHEGKLTPKQLQDWVRNRYYYQTRIPIKDALILSKSEDPAFRRRWIRRIHEHDGEAEGEGGLALWERLGEAVGIPRAELVRQEHVLPGVRMACDDYVHLVRELSLVEAVASSLTEFFSPELMTRRLEAWERHYPWVGSEALDYFRTRVLRARRDSSEAIDFVVSHARSHAMQARCVRALVRKAEILWQLCDALYLHSVLAPAPGPGVRP